MRLGGGGGGVSVVMSGALRAETPLGVCDRETSVQLGENSICRSGNAGPSGTPGEPSSRPNRDETQTEAESG